MCLENVHRTEYQKVQSTVIVNVTFDVIKTLVRQKQVLENQKVENQILKTE